MTKFLSALALFLTTLFSFAQDQHKSFTVKYISNTEIIADGVLDEAIWEIADSANNYWQYFPSDSMLAKQQSEIKMLI